MGHSSLLGTDRAPQEPAGRDTASLGPGDSSDTGSDMAGIGESDDGDPFLPVDVALRDDLPHAGMGPENLSGSASDSGGTGERRSAGLDGGEREAADIGVDRVFSLNGADGGQGDGDDAFEDDEDPDLAFVDAAQAADPLEDETADPDLADEDLEDDEAAETGDRYAEEDDGIPGAKR